MTSLYIHDITLVLFQWINKQIIRTNILPLETGASLVFEQQTSMLTEHIISILSCKKLKGVSVFIFGICFISVCSSFLLAVYKRRGSGVGDGGRRFSPSTEANLLSFYRHNPSTGTDNREAFADNAEKNAASDHDIHCLLYKQQYCRHIEVVE